jgi:hypothetical protein
MGQTYSNFDDAVNGLQAQNDKVKGIYSQLGSSIQDYYSQKNKMANSGGRGMGFAPVSQQQVDPTYFQPQRRGPNNLTFYGGGE